MPSVRRLGRFAWSTTWRLAIAASLASGLWNQSAQAGVVVHDEQTSSPMLLDRPEDYLLRKILISGLHDTAALTLAGNIDSVRLENCRFGDVWAGHNGRGAALEAVGAHVGSFVATDSAFYDAENQLVSLRDGSFGTVTFLHCTFKTSDAALRKIYAASPWRTTLPTTEFYNIDRLELLDNEFVNTTIVIHPSVKLVVFRGDISKIHIESNETQVLRLSPGQDSTLLDEEVFASSEMTLDPITAHAEPTLPVSNVTPLTTAIISTATQPAQKSVVPAHGQTLARISTATAPLHLTPQCSGRNTP